VFDTGANATHARVWQRPDGRLVADITAAADHDAALTHLRFVLAVDDDTSAFTESIRDDALLSRAVHARGTRPTRTTTVAHAVLKAFAGQLITAREAMLIERRVIDRIGRTHAGLAMPPDQDALASLTVADYTACGLNPKRASALCRLIRHVDLEALRTETAERLTARLLRERMIGPWTVGVIALGGLGRYDLGLAGDLNLIRLSANLLGRPATAEDSERLLERYDPWAGLASIHLMRHPLARERRHPRADDDLGTARSAGRPRRRMGGGR